MHTPECQHSSSLVCSAVGSSLIRERAAGRVFPGKTESACLLFNSCVPSSQKVAAILEQSPLISYPVKWPRVEGTHEVPAHPGFCGTDIHLHSGIGRPAVGKWFHNRDL